MLVATGPTKAAPAVRREARELGIGHSISRAWVAGLAAASLKGDLASTSRHPLPVRAPAVPHSRFAVEHVGERGADQDHRDSPSQIAEQMSRVQAHRGPLHLRGGGRLCGSWWTLRKRMKEIAAAERGDQAHLHPDHHEGAVSNVLREFPNLNAVMDEERFELVVKGDHNIGISTDTPNGLYVPVIKQRRAEVDPADRGRDGRR